MVEAHVRLNFDNMLEIYKSGYTRIPVYDTQPQAIIGILYTKDLILVDPGARRSCEDAALRLRSRPSQELADKLLSSLMQVEARGLVVVMMQPLLVL